MHDVAFPLGFRTPQIHMLTSWYMPWLIDQNKPFSQSIISLILESLSSQVILVIDKIASLIIIQVHFQYKAHPDFED